MGHWKGTFAGLAAALWLAAVPAAAEPPRFELIYTEPAETELHQPLRPPAPLWAEVFARASKTIDIEQFYLAEQTGEALDGVLAGLEKAARRGVQVRVLVEEKMRKQSQPTLDRLAQWPNTQVRVLNWALLDPGPERKAGGIIHAKFWVVDGKLGYLGSQNFDWRSLSHIHELGVLIRDSHIAGQLQAIFDHDWQAQARQQAREAAPALPATTAEHNDIGYLLASPRPWLPTGVGDSEAELVRLIDATKQRLRVQVMKYAPLRHGSHAFYAPIDNALRRAAVRGVKVELLVADWNTDRPAIAWLQSLGRVPGVTIKMVTIPTAKRGPIPYARVIHSKYAIFDDAALWVGTSNWEGGYLDESRNVELVIGAAEPVKQASDLFQQLWQSRYAADLDCCREYPVVKRH
ncbi:MAG: phospholipase [Deltaproteobacteria bacterium]|nr:phospholipase [Deltaproteobacteria bacterium]